MKGCSCIAFYLVVVIVFPFLQCFQLPSTILGKSYDFQSSSSLIGQESSSNVFQQQLCFNKRIWPISSKTQLYMIGPPKPRKRAPPPKRNITADTIAAIRARKLNEWEKAREPPKKEVVVTSMQKYHNWRPSVAFLEKVLFVVRKTVDTLTDRDVAGIFDGMSMVGINKETTGNFDEIFNLLIHRFATRHPRPNLHQIIRYFEGVKKMGYQYDELTEKHQRNITNYISIVVKEFRKRPLHDRKIPNLLSSIEKLGIPWSTMREYDRLKILEQMELSNATVSSELSANITSKTKDLPITLTAEQLLVTRTKKPWQIEKELLQKQLQEAAAANAGITISTKKELTEEEQKFWHSTFHDVFGRKKTKKKDENKAKKGTKIEQKIKASTDKAAASTVASAKKDASGGVKGGVAKAAPAATSKAAPAAPSKAAGGGAGGAAKAATKK
jgi:hypothetical protein